MTSQKKKRKIMNHPAAKIHAVDSSSTNKTSPANTPQVTVSTSLSARTVENSPSSAPKHKRSSPSPSTNKSTTISNPIPKKISWQYCLEQSGRKIEDVPGKQNACGVYSIQKCLESEGWTFEQVSKALKFVPNKMIVIEGGCTNDDDAPNNFNFAKNTKRPLGMVKKYSPDSEFPSILLTFPDPTPGTNDGVFIFVITPKDFDRPLRTRIIWDFGLCEKGTGTAEKLVESMLEHAGLKLGNVMATDKIKVIDFVIALMKNPQIPFIKHDNAHFMALVKK